MAKYYYKGLDNRKTSRHLNPAIKRYVQRKEKELGRTCRMIWDYETEEGERYLFAHFCKNWDRLIVTIGYFDKGIRQFITPR